MNFAELVNSVNRIFLHFLNLEQELSRAARQARDIEQIAGLCVPTLFDNLTVSTMDFHLLAQIRSDTFSENLDSLSCQYLLDGRFESEFIQYMNNDKAFYDAYHRREPFLYRCSLFPTEMLCMNVVYQGAAWFCKMLNDEIPASCSFITDSRIACVANLASCAGSRTAFMGKHVEFFRDNLFRAGISSLFSDPHDLRGYWLQSKIALQTGMQDKPSFWYHYFTDHVLSYLKKQAVLELSARYLAAPELLALKHYDQENATEYYHTLKLYLRNNMNALQTSRDLYIARGTMNFRLTRLEKITGLNLRDPDMRLYLEISYALLDE